MAATSVARKASMGSNKIGMYSTCTFLKRTRAATTAEHPSCCEGQAAGAFAAVPGNFRKLLSEGVGVREESRAGVLAAFEVEVMELGASGGDRLEPAVRHLPAGEVEVLEAGASGGRRLEPDVPTVHWP